MNDNFTIKLGDVALKFKGARMLVVERDGRPWHFTHPFQPLKHGSDRGLLRPHVTRRKGTGVVRKAFDRFTGQLFNVVPRGAWPRAIKYSISQVGNACNNIRRDLAKLHWSRLQPVDRAWVEQVAIRLLVPDTEAIGAYLNKVIADRGISLTEADAEALEQVAPEWVFDPEEGLNRIDKVFAEGKTKFLRVGIYLTIGEDREWASLHCWRASPDAPTEWHISPERTWTEEEVVEIVLKHVGPTLLVALEAISSILGLDYDRERIEKFRVADTP